MHIIKCFDYEMPSDSLSAHLFFKIFLGVHATDPIALPCYMHMLIVLHMMTHTITTYKDLCAPGSLILSDGLTTQN